MIEGLFQSSNYQIANRLLDVTAMRHKVIAGNLANTQTPGYRRMEIDPAFMQEMKQAAASGEVGQLPVSAPEVMMDPLAGPGKTDGNNVSLEEELMEMNVNAMEYQFLSDYVSNSLKHLKTAISGRIS